jgi:hypothetical protein
LRAATTQPCQSARWQEPSECRTSNRVESFG